MRNFKQNMFYRTGALHSKSLITAQKKLLLLKM